MQDAYPHYTRTVRDIWFRFVSDDTVFYKGFNLSYIVRSETRKLIPFLSGKFQVAKYLKIRSKKAKVLLNY